MERLIAVFLLILPLGSQATMPLTTIDLTTRALVTSLSYASLDAATPRSTLPPHDYRNDALGDTLSVDVVNPAMRRVVSVPVQLAAVDDLVYVWVERGIPYASVDLNEFARRIWREVVEPVDALWGPDTGAFQIHIVLSEQVGGGLDAYYTYHPFDELAAPRIVINAARFPTLDDPLLWSRLAHEYQHLLRHFDTGSVPSWLNEGYSVYTEQALNLSNTSYLVVEWWVAPQTPLMGWNGTLADYGASLRLVEYIEQRFGGIVRRELSRERGHGYHALKATLRLRTTTNVETLLADLVLDQLVLPVMASPLRAERIQRLPYSTRGTLAQTGTHLWQLDPPASGVLQLDFTQPADAPLIPNVSCGEDRFMFALPVDNSENTLTMTLDLRDEADPTLYFDLWYDLETHWDYAYIAASVDGQTWVDLTTPTMTDQNPYRRADGKGYTGSSSGWASETLDLSAFAGQQVTLRFKVKHDESKTSWGVALDNVRLGRSGAAQTFDEEPTNWRSNGWAWVDGCLPQRTWVQIVQRVNGQHHTVRILTDRPFSQEVALPAGAQGEVFIALTPVTPYTLHPLLYTLNISAR